MAYRDVMRWADAMAKGCAVMVQGDAAEWDIESLSRDGVTLGRDARQDEVPQGQPCARIEWALSFSDEPRVIFRMRRDLTTKEG